MFSFQNLIELLCRDRANNSKHQHSTFELVLLFTAEIILKSLTWILEFKFFSVPKTKNKPNFITICSMY